MHLHKHPKFSVVNAKALSIMCYEDDINTAHNMKSIGRAAVAQLTKRLTRNGQTRVRIREAHIFDITLVMSNNCCSTVDSNQCRRGSDSGALSLSSAARHIDFHSSRRICRLRSAFHSAFTTLSTPLYEFESGQLLSQAYRPQGPGGARAPPVFLKTCRRAPPVL